MISLIATVKNERDTLPQWLESICNQTKKPDEIILVDGGSNDGTWEWLQEQQKNSSIIRIFQKNGNISCGRNFAITQAHGDYIVVADAGCKYELVWFESIFNEITKDTSVMIATGFGPWLKKTDSILVYLIASATIPASCEFKKDWLPSSRSVGFPKKIWKEVGGYPEWLPICEDVVFDITVKKQNVKTVFIRKSLVLWRPRLSFKKYFKQLFNYTRGDGHAKLFLRRQFVRFVVYGVSLVFLFLSFSEPKLLIVLVLGGMIYLCKYVRRWFAFTRRKSVLYRFIGVLFLPLVVVYGDVGKMCGWVVGTYERCSGRINYQKW